MLHILCIIFMIITAPIWITAAIVGAVYAFAICSQIVGAMLIILINLLAR